VTRVVLAMGTWLEVTVSAPDREWALAAGDAALEAVRRAEERLSTWTPRSELAAFNRAPVGEWFELSPELARDLASAVRWHRSTGGGFSPALAPLVRVWGLRGLGRVPDDPELAGARAAADLSNLELEGTRARRLHRDFAIEEGGFAKGVALADAAAAALGGGAVCITLNFGGQLVREGRCGPLRAEVAHPGDRERVVASFPLTTGSAASSGNGARGLVVDGRSVGHILDPETGYPAATSGSVTVVSQDPVAADALSTALFVMGPRRAASWLRANPEHQVVIASENAGRTRLLVSEPLIGLVRVIDPTVSVESLSTLQEEATCLACSASLTSGSGCPP